MTQAMRDWGKAVNNMIAKYSNLQLSVSPNWQLVQIAQKSCDVIGYLHAKYNVSSIVLNYLELVE